MQLLNVACPRKAEQQAFEKLRSLFSGFSVSPIDAQNRFLQTKRPLDGSSPLIHISHGARVGVPCRISDSDGSGCRQPLHQPVGNPWIAPRSKATYSYHISHPVTKYGPCSSRRYKSVVCLWVSSGDLWGPLVGAISGALGDFRRYDKSRFHLLRIWFEGRHSCSYRSWRNYHWTRTTMHHLHRRRTWPCRECRCFLIVLRSSTLLLIQQTMSRWTQLRLTWRIKRRCNKRWLQEWKR